MTDSVTKGGKVNVKKEKILSFLSSSKKSQWSARELYETNLFDGKVTRNYLNVLLLMLHKEGSVTRTANNNRVKGSVEPMFYYSIKEKSDD